MDRIGRFCRDKILFASGLGWVSVVFIGKMKIAFVLGTRPEIIKLASLIHYCDQGGLDYFVIHTNQHYSENLDKIFFEELQLPAPEFNLKVGSGKHGWQTGQMMMKIEAVLEMEKPDVVLVQGDTNSVLAGALAAAKLGIKVAHVEAGLRSYDRSMPEEINRIMVDHMADYLFCPTDKQKRILLKEGIEDQKLFVTGNTVVDAIQLARSWANEGFLNKYKLDAYNYILLTLHRPSNVDNKEILGLHLNNISLLGINSSMPVIFPIHPRTRSNIKKFDLDVPFNIKLIDPVGYLEMISLQRYSKIVLTDSGGIQEEACVLKVPSLNLRDTTDRPECMEVGASLLVSYDLSLLRKGYEHFDKMDAFHWENPFGNGSAYKKIMKIIMKGKRLHKSIEFSGSSSLFVGKFKSMN